MVAGHRIRGQGGCSIGTVVDPFTEIFVSKDVRRAERAVDREITTLRAQLAPRVPTGADTSEFVGKSATRVLDKQGVVGAKRPKGKKRNKKRMLEALNTGKSASRVRGKKARAAVKVLARQLKSRVEKAANTGDRDGAMRALTELDTLSMGQVPLLAKAAGKAKSRVAGYALRATVGERIQQELAPISARLLDPDPREIDRAWTEMNGGQS